VVGEDKDLIHQTTGNKIHEPASKIPQIIHWKQVMDPSAEIASVGAAR
jgi:hypothetical protein